MTRLRLLLTLVAACALAAPAAASAAAPTTWLCKPGMAADPCTGSLTTTLVPAGGGPAAREVARPARAAKVDCFYVYPTVSDQQRTNATLARDPEVKAIARFQAARFSQHCRMFAPVYRQLTLRAIATPRIASDAAAVAYSRVRDAWREYLRRHNDGRGVVLIGHSQGTYMLRELIKREIDARPAVRRRLISGLLLGGNVEVRRGSDRGGDFRSVPACRRADQLGCVVAYSMFNEVPSADARVGRTPATGREILCTNPAALGGGSGTLDAYTPTFAFPGTIGLLTRQATTLPPASTPWIGFPDRATARCRRQGSASWLQVDERQGDPRPTFKATIGPMWGLHLGDVNIAYGQLTDIVRRQTRAYLRRSR